MVKHPRAAVISGPVFVMRLRDRWVVDYTVHSFHQTQEEAVRVGRKVAIAEGKELIVSGRDGRVRSKDSYGTETAALDKEH